MVTGFCGLRLNSRYFEESKQGLIFTNYTYTITFDIDHPLAYVVYTPLSENVIVFKFTLIMKHGIETSSFGILGLVKCEC